MLRRAVCSRLPSQSSICSRKYFGGLSKAREAWNGRLVISEEVEHALQSSEPVTALESTIISHGMPYPQNLTTAQSLETILRDKKVTPATIALFDGRVHVGLSNSQLERLADQSTSSSPKYERKVKVSRRDIAPTLASKVVGGTTVAGTMYVAESVGIGMFVTGGIGGVHRGAENSMDVSADLIELGRTAMGVVCAGAKSILDIPRTLEVLETQGVCVATYGETSDFPAFYTPSSGQKSPWTVNNPVAAAEFIGAGLSLPTPLSTLLAVPIPSEYSARGDEVQRAVEIAVRESIEQGIDKRGKEVTPWLLKRVGELTGGSALELNIKLIENNARVGADVAVQLAKLQKESSSSHASSSAYVFTPPTLTSAPQTAKANLSERSKTDLPSPRVIVIGSAAMDLTSHSALPLSPRSTTPGSIYLTPGGVGRNVAEAAQNLLSKNEVMLVSALGSDVETPMIDGVRTPDAVGKMLLSEMGDAGMRTDGLSVMAGQRTAACTLVLEGNMDLVNGVADMGIVENLQSDQVERAIRDDRPEMVVFDCNPKVEVIQHILQVSSEESIPTFCDPTSIPKLPRLVSALIPLIPSSPLDPRPLSHIAPNLLELDLLYSALTADTLSSDVSSRSWEYVNSLNLDSTFRARLEKFTSAKDREWIRSQGVIQKTISCFPFVGSFWIKCGSLGLLVVSRSQAPLIRAGLGSETWTGFTHELGGKHGYLSIIHFPAGKVDPSEIVSTTGAGDTLSGGLVAGLITSMRINSGDKSNLAPPDLGWVRTAMDRAERSIKSRRAVG